VHVAQDNLSEGSNGFRNLAIGVEVAFKSKADPSDALVNFLQAAFWAVCYRKNSTRLLPI
jgi:hypothetical protein